ncbi:MAG: hemerythrin domain-containing protein [Chitinophagaceae bacterium]|nr:hemerythrin domain-containing protein [Chitinophagaceae bacterium]
MKRDEAIAPLSREHHSTLILAQLLKLHAPVYNGLPASVADKITYAREQFNSTIQHHFQQEENMLELTKGINSEMDTLAGEIKNEHRQLTALFNSLDTAADPEKTMDTLANMLQDHIRKEERVLFPLLQQHCTEDQLQQVHKLLH